MSSDPWEHAAKCRYCQRPVLHTGYEEYGKNKKTGRYIKRYELYYCYYCRKHFKAQKQNPVSRTVKGNIRSDFTKIVILKAISELESDKVVSDKGYTSR